MWDQERFSQISVLWQTGLDVPGHTTDDGHAQ